MKTWVASCNCGQLRLRCQSDPVRISLCHCRECQRRTGSVFGTQARFARSAVAIEGNAAHWTRAGDSGQTATFSFCPTCASTVFWEAGGAEDFLMVAVGAFADQSFPAPGVSVYEERRHPWSLAATQLPLDHQF